MKRSRDKQDTDFIDEDIPIGEWGEDDLDMGRVNQQLMSKLAAEEKLMKKKKLDIGMWDNTMANQVSHVNKNKLLKD